MRQNLEKRLAALMDESQENRKKYMEKKYAVRYHKVRFFERIKIERTIKKLKKSLKISSDASLKDALAMAEEDLEYILHFPKGEKYVSLLKDSEDPEAQQHLESERKRLRLLVKQQLRDEAIVNELNEGRSSAEQTNVTLDKEAKPVPLECYDESESEENIEDDEFFAQSSEELSESGEDMPMTSDVNEQSDTSQVDTSLEEEDGDLSSSMEDDMEGREPESEVAGTIQPIPEKKSHDVIRANKEEKYRGNNSRDSIPKRRNANKTRMPKKVSSIPPKGKKQSSAKKKDAKQPLRTRAEGGRKRRRKK